MNYINFYKQMRVILIYDLPMVDDNDRKIYNKFHKNLKKLGYYMLQYSVYTKVVTNDSSYKQNEKRLKNIIPKQGNLIMLKITEKQFQDMVYLRGERNKFETIVGGNELVIFKGGEND